MCTYPSLSVSDALSEFNCRGWTVFDADVEMTAWARACAPVADRLLRAPELDHWWRCGRTWFAGVNVLPNDGRGAIAPESVPALSGAAVDFVRDELGYRDVEFDPGQISIVTEGYPVQGEEETEAAHRYRVNRCAAHVDGLERIMPERRRRLSETHGFLLGIPLGDAGLEEGAFMVWEGSHEVMRAAFRARFAGVDPVDWRGLDITDAYTEARKQVFANCKPVELAPGLGSAYVMHPLALHGVAPWRGGERPSRAVAYFRPDTFGGDPEKWLAA